MSTDKKPHVSRNRQPRQHSSFKKITPEYRAHLKRNAKPPKPKRKA